MELVGQAWALVSVWQREILAALSATLRAGVGQNAPAHMMPPDCRTALLYATLYSQEDKLD